MKQFSLALVLLISFSFFGQAQLNTEQKLIKKTFFDFLQFYKKNEKTFNSFRLYKGTGKENNPPYKIQWNEVNRYFTYLRSKVVFVGEAYISSEKREFKFYDSCYKADPQEEIAVGFDYDRWAGGQEETQYMIEWHTKASNKYEVLIKGNTAVLRIGSPLWDGAPEKDWSWYLVPFSKEKGKWKMAGNILPEDSEESEEN